MAFDIGKIGQKVYINTTRQEYKGIIKSIKVGSMQYEVEITEVINGDKAVGDVILFQFKHTTIEDDKRELSRTRVDNKMVAEWVGRRIAKHKIVEYLGFWKKDNWKQSKHWFRVVHDNGSETEKTLGTLRKLVKAEEKRLVKKEEERLAKQKEKQEKLEQKEKAEKKLQGEVVEKKKAKDTKGKEDNSKGLEVDLEKGMNKDEGEQTSLGIR